ncbi:flagellar hook-length control protein FliK [Herbaspirillum hiltneri N3]|uniref:Flagellar hook-length control protein FliK n=1 Tax=Herbaspirillum hiltneri N3 TaxID=1262470 RepID=A0ABN4I085_9BURK|nr:flagellar hook-length control protein FliK [Herbaspirillum hiltneri]AKZ63021.1 flagellar hook-length control protein FliK [Herbaspirillum hiltneri N3]
MIPRADIALTVQPVAAVDAPTAIVSVADAKQEAFSRLAQIANGQQLQAKVLSTYNDGTYLVRIANTAARMVLPTSTRTGDTLQLTMVGKDPRPTFLLTESSRREDDESTEVSLSTAGRAMEKDMKSLKAAQQGLTNVVTRDNQLDEGDAKNAAPNQLAPESTKTSLSSAGKLVDALLHASEESDLPSAIKPGSPLVANPTSNTPQLANALRDSVALSGAFYESHVAEWADGKRPMTELLKEPQAQLGQQTQAAGVSSLLNTTDPANTQLGQLINLQLNALEQQRIVWHGEVWPGQQMEWEINRDSPDQQQQNAQEDEFAPSWHSVVRFNFEHLGSVSASIRLIGQQIHMQVRTANDVTAAALRANGSMLSDAMEAAGSSLDSLIVKRDEQA